MRIRSIKPQFFRDSKILDLTHVARLLFIGLWCCADREGRMEFDPRELRHQVLPDESQATVDASFVELKASGLIVLYEVKRRKYLSIPGFLKHQIPHHREQPSTSPGLALGRAIPKQVEGRSVSSILSGELSEGTVRTTLAESRAPRSRVFPVGFSDAWSSYPHYQTRSSRKKSAQVWEKLGLEAHVETVIAWIDASASSKDWERDGGRFVPAMEVWLGKVDVSAPPPKPELPQYVREIEPELTPAEQTKVFEENWRKKRGLSNA